MQWPRGDARASPRGQERCGCWLGTRKGRFSSVAAPCRRELLPIRPHSQESGLWRGGRDQPPHHRYYGLVRTCGWRRMADRCPPSQDGSDAILWIRSSAPGKRIGGPGVAFVPRREPWFELRVSRWSPLTDLQAPATFRRGEMTEWPKVPDSKSGVSARAPWVRLPLSPPGGS